MVTNDEDGGPSTTSGSEPASGQESGEPISGEGEDDREAAPQAGDGARTIHPCTQFLFHTMPVAEEPRCVNCDAPVANVVCGRVSPCPACGVPYPLGDCSDYAGN